MGTGFSPLLLLFGLCPVWKAFSVSYTLAGTASSLLQIAVPLGVVIGWSLARPARASRAFVWFTGAMGTFATLVLCALESLSVEPGTHAALQAVASVAFFTSYALFFLLWAQMYARLNVSRAGAAIGGSYTLSSLVFFALRWLDPLLCLGIAAGLPLISSGALVICLDASETHTGDGRPRYTRISELLGSKLFPWRFIIAIAACSLAAGVSRAHTSAPEDLLAVGVAGTLCIAAVILSPKLHAATVYEAYRLVFTAMALCLLAGLVVGVASVAHLLIGIAQTLSSIMLVLVLCDSSHRFGLPVLPVVAIARAITATAFFVGGTLSRVTLDTFGDTSAVSTAVYGIAAAIIVVVSLWWLSGGPVDIGQPEQPREQPEDEAAREHEETGRIPQALESLIRERALQLGSEYGLSKRETEVLSLLAWGKSAKRIEEMLVLSPNTVKTHVRHIYAKLGIHSRAELDALLFDESVPSPRA